MAKTQKFTSSGKKSEWDNIFIFLLSPFESGIDDVYLNTSGEAKPLVPRGASPFSVTSFTSLMAQSKSARRTLPSFINTFLAGKRKQNKINFFWSKLVFITGWYQPKLILDSLFTALLKCTYDEVPCIVGNSWKSIVMTSVKIWDDLS